MRSSLRNPFAASIGAATLALLAVRGGVASAAAPEQSPEIVDSRIETIGLFKNGLAVVRRTITLPTAGTYDVLDLPEPVHGTFWVESTANLSVRMAEAKIPRSQLLAHDPEAVDEPLPDLTNHDLADAVVTVHFKSEHLSPVTGRVVAPGPDEREWDRSYGWSRPRHGWWWSGWSNRGYQPSGSGFPRLVLDTDAGRIVLTTDIIAHLRIDEEAPDSATERRPVMRIEAAPSKGDGSATASTPIEINILHLAKGAAWAPSYALDISDDSLLDLKQKAVIRNEMEELEDVEFLLITGFPGIEFGHVLSPMSPASSLSSFFKALGQENRLSHSSRGDVMSQVVMTNAPSPHAGGGAPSTDAALAGEDLHYHSVGRHSLAVGETLMLNTAAAQPPHERLVHYRVTDSREPRYWWSYSWQRENRVSEIWDAVRFENPFDRPMTTAPAMVVRDGLVLGQGMIYWTPPGGEVISNITRSLSVAGVLSETPRSAERKKYEIEGRTIYRTPIDGEITLTNQRHEAVTVLVQVDYHGELIEAKGAPDNRPRGSRSWDRSPANRLVWEIELEPGEEKTLTYEYLTRS